SWATRRAPRRWTRCARRCGGSSPTARWTSAARRSDATASTPGLPAVPGVPALDLDPAADPAAVALRVGVAGVVLGDPVDVLQVRVVVQRDVAIPRVAVEDRDRHARVLAQVLEALAALVHVHEHAAVLPEVPGGD